MKYGVRLSMFLYYIFVRNLPQRKCFGFKLPCEIVVSRFHTAG